ncbi:solute carrier family 22 member 20-like [Haemaphysalis longicornis]
MRWDMVCGRRWYEQLYRSAYMVGSAVSVPPVALCSHQVGRQPMLRGCVLVLLASGLVAAAAPTALVFIVARFFAAAAANALEVVSFVLLFESTPPAPRVAFCALAICWPMVLAPLYMALAGLLVLDWRLYHMALLVPSLVLVAGLHATQESSHWLLVHGRFAEARGVALCAARVNDEDEDVVEARLKRVQEALSTPRSSQRSLCGLYLSRVMLSHCVVFCGCWFLLHVAWHYGLLAQFEAETKWAIVVGNVPVMGIAYLAVMHFGRLRPLVLALLALALILAYQAAALFAGRFSSPSGPRLWRRLLVNAAYMMLNVHTVATFPTEVRIAAYSCAFLCGRLGALASALGASVQLVEKALPERFRYVPLSVTAFLLASFALLLLTQTGKGFDELVAKPPLKKDRSARLRALRSLSNAGPGEEAARDDDLRSPRLASPPRLQFDEGSM